ncbi:MAG: hypothetical protein Q8K65_12065, partial [Alphaproteobacteria bacterium]|nr:hypothetical protein [Alphaproteobacteria bacterium]
IAGCFAELSDTCLKAADNSMQRPCCQLGSGMDATTAWTGKFAQEMAASSGGPFCKATKADPLAIVCMTKPIYQRCLQGYKGTLPPDCASTEKHPGGVSKSLCCRFDESDLAGVAGVKDVQGFVKGQNIVKSGSCATGGMLKGLSYDPRIVNCVNGVASDACKKKFPGECTPSASGFVSAPCCDISVFGSEAAGKARPYNPAERSAEDLALAAKALANAKGGCAAAQGPSGRQEDAFRLVCKTEAALKQCVKDLGRHGQTACNKKLSANGWVTAPCCERAMESLSGRAGGTPANDMKAPKPADIKLQGGGLGSGGVTPRAGTGIGAGRGNTAPQDAGKVRAPGAVGGRSLSPSPMPASRDIPGRDTEEAEDAPARAPSHYKP